MGESLSESDTDKDDNEDEEETSEAVRSLLYIQNELIGNVLGGLACA